MSDEVVERSSAEVEKVMRAAAQIGLLLAERNRQRLWMAEQASRQQADRVRATVEEQRRMAAPIYRKATTSAFWERARPEDAAFVYGMARRFAHVDPVAQEAVSRCQDQAAKLWGVDLAQDSRPVTSKDVPTQAVATVAPLLRGEESTDLDALVDESAHASNAAEPHRGASASPTPTPSSDQVDVKGARAWFEKNYGSQGVLLSSTPEAERDRYAVTLQAALAAEGYDLGNPPRIVDPSSYKFEDKWLSSVGACQELGDWLAMDPSGINDRIDPRALPAFHASWQIVQDGDYPELDNWGWNVGEKAMETAYGADELDAGQVRLVGDKPQPGTYLPAMRQAAAAEAAEAGLEVDVYLDHLQPVQRRAIMVGVRPVEGDYEKYGQGKARAAQYRVAYAKASAAQRPEWSSRSQAAKEDQGLHAGTAAAVVATAGEAADQALTEPTPRWDSQEARDSWAVEMVAKGVDPVAVRAAKSADQVLTEPVGSALRGPNRGNGAVRPPEHYVAAAMGRQAGAHQG